ncbi:unnamed protein product, partial [Closterium sp. NIES-54]
MTSAASSEARRESTESLQRSIQGDFHGAGRLLPPSAARDSLATADAESATTNARDPEGVTVAGTAAHIRRLKDTWRQEQHRLRQRLVVGDTLDFQPPPLLRAAGNAENGEHAEERTESAGRVEIQGARAHVEGAGDARVEYGGGRAGEQKHDWNGNQQPLTPPNRSQPSQIQLPQEETAQVQPVESQPAQIQLPQIQPPPVHSPQIRPPLALVGGVDVSFHRRDPDLAAACLAVVAFPSLHLLHSEIALTRVTQPYIPGFLAFRECGVLVGLIRRLRDTHPHLVPQ